MDQFKWFLVINLQVSLMSESLKRGLRDRSKRRHFDSQNEEGENFPYSKPYSRQFVNPSQQLNQQAKLLIKFINTTNRLYNHYHHNLLSIQSQPADPVDKREPKTNKKEENGKENTKKNGEGNKSGEVEANRKGKQIYSNAKNKGSQKIQISKDPNFLMQFREKALASANSILELEKLMPKTPKGNAMSITKVLKQAAKLKQINQAKKEERQKLQISIGVDKSKFKVVESKPFKRASYHVAIAYHIYDEMGKGQNGVKDPTSASRKLKEQMGKQQ